MDPLYETTWAAFSELTLRRRAIRDFDGEPVSDEDMRAILEAALLAPSSGGLQPFELHWVRDEALRARVAEACNGQRAAASAAALVVVVGRWQDVARTHERFLAGIEADARYDEASRAYHRARTKDTQLLAGAPVLRFIAGLIFGPLSALNPLFLFAPIGAKGLYHWAMRNALYAAQTLMLAASARGLDSCPMEGFDPRPIAKLLRLGRHTAIPLVIAIGRRSPQARLEPRWRRPFTDVVVVH